MGKLYWNGIFTAIIMVVMTSCQPQTQNGQQEPVSNGMVLTGDMMGKEFVIATGDQDEIVMDLVGAFNRMNLDSVWMHAADTIAFHGSDGYVGPFTKADMKNLFDNVDSLRWVVHAVIPIKLEGTEGRMSVFADGEETIYMKDGTVQRKKLFERFIFRGDTLVGVRQWEAAMPGDKSSQE